jgi:hypothetical protein
LVWKKLYEYAKLTNKFKVVVGWESLIRYNPLILLELCDISIRTLQKIIFFDF